jgi:hypothetical protein
MSLVLRFLGHEFCGDTLKMNATSRGFAFAFCSAT